MRKLSSVLVVAAVLGAAHGVESGSSGQKGSADSVDCLADFNAARERAGLDAIIAETDAKKKLPTENEEYIAAICSAIQEGKVVNITEANTKREGTYAYAPETGPADGCSAAVSYWKKAHVNFGELPPEYEEKKDVYADSQNVSLVALYNPKEGATLDCAYITCPISTATTTAAPTTTSATTSSSSSSDAGGVGGGTGGSGAGGGSGNTGGSGDGGSSGGSFFSAERRAGASASRDIQGRASAAAPIFYPVSRDGDSEDPQRTGPSVRRLSTTSETVTGLVCLTNPAALVKGEKPFTEDVWANIKRAIENSASASTQSALLATALLLLTSFMVL